MREFEDSAFLNIVPERKGSGGENSIYQVRLQREVPQVVLNPCAQKHGVTEHSLPTSNQFYFRSPTQRPKAGNSMVAP